VTEPEHERALVRAFIIPNRRERYLRLLATARGRAKLRRSLAHCRDLDPRFARELSADMQTPAQIAALLQERGAPDECVILAEDSALDGRRMRLMETLEAIVGRGMGAFASCVPGRLAFYEGEDLGERYILERQAFHTP
jgi:hypothetical protein